MAHILAQKKYHLSKLRSNHLTFLRQQFLSKSSFSPQILHLPELYSKVEQKLIFYNLKIGEILENRTDNFEFDPFPISIFILEPFTYFSLHVKFYFDIKSKRFTDVVKHIILPVSHSNRKFVIPVPVSCRSTHVCLRNQNFDVSKAFLFFLI